jgi:hypothetical protein
VPQLLAIEGEERERERRVSEEEGVECGFW